MRKKEQIKKFNLSIVCICLFIIMGIGIAYAAFTYNKTSANNQFIMGNLYLNFYEHSNIVIENAFPESDSSARNNHGKKIVDYNGQNVIIRDNELLFSIDGVNESNKDFYFDFSLDYGDDIENKTRIDSSYIKFDFIRIDDNGDESFLIKGENLLYLSERYIYSDVMNAYDEVPNATYKLRFWISDELTYGENGLYTLEEFKNLFFSVKLKVDGNYTQRVVANLDGGEINSNIGNSLSELVYNIYFDKISVGAYKDYLNKIDGVSSFGNGTMTKLGGSSIIKNNSDGVIEVYKISDYGTYDLFIYSINPKLPADCSNMFTKFTNLRTIEFKNVDSSEVTNMSGMFKGLEYLYRVSLKGLDTSNVTTMKEMFANSGVFDVDLGNIDISSLTDSSYMFYNCVKLSKIYCDPDSNINFGNVSINNDMVTNDTFLCGLLARSGSDYGLYDSSKTDGTYLNSNINNQYYFTYNKISVSKTTIPENYYLKNYDFGNGLYVNDTVNLEYICLDLSTIQKIYNNAINKYMINSDIYAWFGTDKTLYIASNKEINTGTNVKSLFSINYNNSYGTDYYSPFSLTNYYNLIQRMSFKNLDFSNAKDCRNLFYYGSSLKYIDFQSLDFSNVTSMYAFFNGCISLEEVDEYFLNAPNCTEFGRMFSNCRRLKKINFELFDISNAKGEYGLQGLISFCDALDLYDKNSIDFSFIDTSGVTNLSGFFAGVNFGGAAVIPEDFVISPGVTKYSYFLSSATYTSIDLSGLHLNSGDTLSYFFYGCRLTKLTKEDLDFLPPNLLSFYYLFYYAGNLVEVDLSGLVYTSHNINTFYTINMSYMFCSCYYLKNVYFPNLPDYNYSINLNSTFEYSGMERISFASMGYNYFSNLNYSFESCSSLIDIDFGNLLCSSRYLYCTFKGCTNIEELDLNGLFEWKFPNSEYTLPSTSSNSLYRTFYQCSKLKSVDLRNFFGKDISNIYSVDLNDSFYSCSSLKNIFIPGNYVYSGKYASYLTSTYSNTFYGCSSLVGSAGTIYDSTKCDSSMFRIDGMYNDGKGGYLTVDWNYAKNTYDYSYVYNNAYSSYSSSFYNLDYMSNLLVKVFTQLYSDGYSSYWSGSNYSAGANSIKILYSDSSYFNSASSNGYTLVSIYNGVSLPYKFDTSTRTLYIITDKPLHFTYGLSTSGSLSSNIFYTNLASSFSSNVPYAIGELVMDCIDFDFDNLRYLFCSMSNLKRIYGLAGKTMKTSSFYCTFNACNSLTSIDLSNIIAPNLTDMTAMFYSDSSLTSINLSHIVAPHLSTLPSLFYGTNPSSLSFYGTTFEINNSFNLFNSSSLYNISNMQSVTDFRHLVLSGGVTSGIGSYLLYGSFNYTFDLSGWDFTNVTSTNNMFAGFAPNDIIGEEYWNLENVKTFEYMFYNANIQNLDTSRWKLSSATSLRYMFNNAQIETIDLSDSDLSSVTDMSYMFISCKATTISLRNCNTSSLTSIYVLAQNCSFLTTLDIADLNTQNVTSFSSVISNCNSLTNLGNDTNTLYWDTSKVTTMSGFINSCNSINCLDLSHFDVSKCTVFGGCVPNVPEVNISNWKFGNNITNFNTFSAYSPSSDKINNSHLIARNWDFSESDYGFGGPIYSGNYNYVDFSGMKLNSSIAPSAPFLYDFKYLLGIDFTGCEGIYSEGIYNFISSGSSDNGSSSSENFYFYVFAESDFTLHRRDGGASNLFSTRNLKVYDSIRGNRTIDSISAYDSSDGDLHYVVSDGSNDGYFTDVKYKDSFWVYSEFYD